MSNRKTSEIAGCYAAEDALFTITIRCMGCQPTPNVWHRTARRSVLNRMKHALCDHSTQSSNQPIQQMQPTGSDSLSIARWLI